MINIDFLIAYARLKNDRFGSTTVAVRKTLSREARAPEKRLNLEKTFKRSVFNGLEELLNKNQAFQWQSNC